MITVIGGLLLKAAVGTAWEGTVGRFTAGRLFGPLVIALAAIGLYFGITKGLPAMVAAHDARVARQAEQKATAEFQLKVAKAKAEALENAVRQQSETLKAREGDLDALRVVLEDMEKEKRDARLSSPNGSSVVVAPDDPWLRPRRR